MRLWVKRFLKVAKPAPKYWAVHNYVSANQLKLKGTKSMLKLTKRGEIWITEVGGLIKRRSSFVGKVKMREGPAHAKRVTRFIFDRIIPLSSRIKRVYLFHWNAAGPTDTWDSGLVAPDGTARGTLAIVKSKLGRRARRPARRRDRRPRRRADRLRPLRPRGRDPRLASRRSRLLR
jgi:hypothetical protein